MNTIDTPRINIVITPQKPNLPPVEEVPRPVENTTKVEQTLPTRERSEHIIDEMV